MKLCKENNRNSLFGKLNLSKARIDINNHYIKIIFKGVQLPSGWQAVLQKELIQIPIFGKQYNYCIKYIEYNDNFSSVNLDTSFYVFIYGIDCKIKLDEDETEVKFTEDVRQELEIKKQEWKENALKEDLMALSILMNLNFQLYDYLIDIMILKNKKNNKLYAKYKFDGIDKSIFKKNYSSIDIYREIRFVIEKNFRERQYEKYGVSSLLNSCKYCGKVNHSSKNVI